MASSSSMASPASSPYPHYDIFLNHRGTDVKATFAKDLYHRLTCYRLQVFLDDPEMKPGCDIFPQIEAAIGVASVNVAIFSPRYAESKWCLDELVLMVASMNSRAAVILPVFYNVKPYELQYAGRYSDDLRKHEEKKHHDLQTIQKWRDALRRVAKISGFDLDACNGNEEELLEKVVQAVRERVPKPPLYVAKFPTGLGEKLQELQTTVLSHEEGRQEAKVVGIVGGGGIGKTTLAKEYFNGQTSEYGGSSFLFDVRENAARRSLHSLQSNLLNDLKGMNIRIDSCEDGIGKLKKNLSACQVLVILDDVDHLDQLDAFLPIKDVLHPKSLILVTSRDEGLLRSARIAESSIYHLSGLNRIHSQQLFCSHAFSQSYPLPEYENLVDGFLKACDGLPLSLKVFGALLYGKDNQSYWEGVLRGVNKTLHADIQKTLRISYDSLSEEEQKIFLDIACFAIGEDRDKWIKIWNGSGWQGLVGFRNLQYKCLVEVNMPPLKQCLPYDARPHVVDSFDFSTDIFCEDKEIRMHDHLRDLGRHIADTEVHFSRLMAHHVRNSGETLRDLLEESPSVNPVVRGICSKGLLSLNEADHEVSWIRKLQLWVLRSSQLLNMSTAFEICCASHEVSRITKLQLLDAQGSHVERILPSVRSPKLIWLRWNNCPFASLPSWIPLWDLRVLEVSGGKLERLWKEQQAPLQLEELIINSPLSGFPKSIGQLKRLQKIVLLQIDSRYGPLVSLPEEFYDLCSLKYLIVRHCRDIFLFRRHCGDICGFGDLGKLTNLQHIDLEGCCNFNYLPNSLGNLSNLQYLSLSWCQSLNYLPDSLGNLSNLEFLCLCGCNSLKNLPDSLGNLSNLQYLGLSSCRELKLLPDSLWNLRNLRCLQMDGCRMLEMLPGSANMLATNIREINLGGCRSLEMLPNCFGSLTNLRHLYLHGCESLEMLPDSFGNLTNLQYIHLGMCRSLKRIPNSLRNHVNLQRIDLTDCTSLEILPDSFGTLISLQVIYLSGCTRLEMLPESFGNLTSLQHINMGGCKKLKMLPTSFWNLLQLKHVHLSSSLTISSEALGNIISLECIDEEEYCVQMDSLLPQAVRQPCLEWMTLLGTNMKKLPSDIAGLSNLELLTLRSPSLEVLPPSFGYLKSLKELCLYRCQKLQCLPQSIGLLTQLTELWIGECGIQYLPPAVMKLNNLERLYVWQCPLQELPFRKEEGVEGDTTLLAESSRGKRVQLSELDSSAEKGMMVKLKDLSLSKTEISEISFPEGVCPNLQRLDISRCSNLVEVGGALPVTLKEMWLRSSNALRKIGRLDGLVQLSALIIRGCPIQVDELVLPNHNLIREERDKAWDQLPDLKSKERDKGRFFRSRCARRYDILMQNLE